MTDNSLPTVFGVVGDSSTNLQSYIVMSDVFNKIYHFYIENFRLYFINIKI